MATSNKPKKSIILDAAALAFASNGVDQTSIDDVARALGATKGKIYHHFRSKGELVCAIRKYSVELTLDRVRPLFKSSSEPSLKFYKMAFAHVEAMMSELSYHRVVVEEMRGSETGSTTAHEREISLRISRTVLEAGIASGVFRKQNISVALRSFLMMLHAPIYWYEPRTDENEKDIADQLALMALKAVCA